MPGGADAIARWNAKDDEPFQKLHDRMAEWAKVQEADEAADYARRALRPV